MACCCRFKYLCVCISGQGYTNPRLLYVYFIKRSTLEVRRSQSHDAEDRFGDLAEALFSTLARGSSRFIVSDVIWCSLFVFGL